MLKQLRAERTYREISVTNVYFLHQPALRWEFLTQEHGVLLHKVDIFFVDGRANDWAVLFQAPASEWAQADPRFHASVASLRVK